MSDERLTNPNKAKQAEVFQKGLENAFSQLIKTVEEKFSDFNAEVGHRISGLGEYTSKNLQGLRDKIRLGQLTQTVFDISLNSLLEELIENGVLDKAKYEKRTKDLLDKNLKKDDAVDPK